MFGVLKNHVVKDFALSGIFIFAIYGITHNPIVRPIPKPTPGLWSIQFMQHPLLFGFAGHNYLALRNERGDIVSELHGLATDHATKEWKYVGSRPTDLLQVWEFGTGKYLAQKQFPGRVLHEGSQEDVLATWNQAVSCKNIINSMNLLYPPYGISLRSETVNSNSVAYTLASCMGLDVDHIGIWTPGAAMNLLQR